MKKLFVIAFCCIMSSSTCVFAMEKQVLETMKKATRYMMEEVSYEGGFVWNYLPDFSRQWGELEAYRTMVWIQPPGTPAMGHVMLDAYHATHDEYYYQCAEKIANALLWGQLPCGGWNYMFDFAGENSIRNWYETIGKNAWRLEEFQHYYGNVTFDDGGTIQAAEFLLRLYVEKNDPAYRVPLEKTIQLVLDSQYPMGGWPQRYPLMYNHPFQGQADYSSFVTLNDDVLTGNIDFLIKCYQSLGMQSLKEPILRAMNAVLLLQQGEPYAGWADQYTVDDLQPAHARSYEPRAVSVTTTTKMIRNLLNYYQLTGNTKFLSGIPTAIHFLETCSRLDVTNKKLSEGGGYRVARFVDPDTGRPLFVHRIGSNVQNGHYYINDNPENTIAHYSSFAFVNAGQLREQYEKVKNISREELAIRSPFIQKQRVHLNTYYYKAHGKQQNQVEAVINSLSENGIWLSKLSQTSNPYQKMDLMERSTDAQYVRTMVGDAYDTSVYSRKDGVQGISTQTYINNMTILIHYVAAEQENKSIKK